MSPAALAPAERSLALDDDQERILLRRFEDAVASLAEADGNDAMAGLFARQEFERASRIATNMRGHIR